MFTCYDKELILSLDKLTCWLYALVTPNFHWTRGIEKACCLQAREIKSNTHPEPDSSCYGKVWRIFWESACPAGSGAIFYVAANKWHRPRKSGIGANSTEKKKSVLKKWAAGCAFHRFIKARAHTHILVRWNAANRARHPIKYLGGHGHLHQSGYSRRTMSHLSAGWYSGDLCLYTPRYAEAMREDAARGRFLLQKSHSTK